MTPMSVTAIVDKSGISLRKAPLRESMTSLWLGVTRTSGSSDRGSRILVPEIRAFDTLRVFHWRD